MTLQRPVVTMILLAIGTSGGMADNWTSWRGPTSNGISTERNLPTSWSTDHNVAWRLGLPGPAGATPVDWEDQIFLTTVDGDQLVLICVGTDGTQQWSRKIDQGNQDVRGDEGNYASPSPVTDGQHVWTLMATGKMACFTMTGEPVWDLDLQERY